MSLPNINPQSTKAWEELSEHFQNIKDTHLKSLFESNSKRAESLKINWDDFYVDYSKHRITKETIGLLIKLANEVQLKDAIEQYFSSSVALISLDSMVQF